MKEVAVLGLGAMGSRMVARLASAGFSVRVWNRSPVAAARVSGVAQVAETPRKAVEGADAVISMLTDDEASQTVWLDRADAAIHGLGASAIAIESGTVTPGWIRELGAQTERRGAAIVDAPVVGSRLQADTGQLIHLIGGDSNTVEAALPILAAIGSAQHHVGPLGAGATMKLAVNAIFASQITVIAEWMSVLRGHGFSPGRIMETLGALPVTSPAARGAMSLMVANDVSPLFPISLVEKDLRYALSLMPDELHHDASSPIALPQDEYQRSAASITRATWEAFSDATRQGFGADNITGISQLFAQSIAQH